MRQTGFSDTRIDAVIVKAAMQASKAQATLLQAVQVAEFGKLAGFSRGQRASAVASTQARPEITAASRAKQITRESVEAYQSLYTEAVLDSPIEKSPCGPSPDFN